MSYQGTIFPGVLKDQYEICPVEIVASIPYELSDYQYAVYLSFCINARSITSEQLTRLIESDFTELELLLMRKN